MLVTSELILGRYHMNRTYGLLKEVGGIMFLALIPHLSLVNVTVLHHPFHEQIVVPTTTTSFPIAEGKSFTFHEKNLIADSKR